MAEDFYEEDDFSEESFPNEEQAPQHQITSGTVWLMVSVALFVDFFQFLLTFIPFIGWVMAMIVGFFAEMGFLLWFKIKGISYSKNPKSFLATWIIVPIIEFIPIVNALPSLTTGVLITCLKARVEEKVEGVI